MRAKHHSDGYHPDSLHHEGLKHPSRPAQMLFHPHLRVEAVAVNEVQLGYELKTGKF